MTAMNLLKAATAFWHQKLESVVHSQKMLDRQFSVKDFQAMMLGNYHLHKLVEPKVAACFSHYLPELNYAQERMKLHLLHQDLRDLGLEVSPFPFQDVEMDGVPAALGAAYVLEGATLGGQVIRRALLNHPELSGLCQFHYYDCYGPELRSRWLAFSHRVNQHLQSEADIQKACFMACLVFERACEIFAQFCQSEDVKSTPQEVLV